MSAGKRKPGQAMIKAQRAFPRCCHMAILAIAAELAAMRILAGMATATITGQPPVLVCRPVTRRAGYPLMRAGKRIFGKSVIEGRPVKLDQAKPASLVVRMAVLASTGARRSMLAVEV